MILYLDASALVKRYIEEPGTPFVMEAIAEAEIVGTYQLDRGRVLGGGCRMVSNPATAFLKTGLQPSPRTPSQYKVNHQSGRSLCSTG